ncbi:MAG: hypothetical protein L0Y73_01265 [Candidatus Aminicenantes bacterium]|nr:hypothetical protein [Candidatus Aminicenantes bacterium]
MKRYLSFIPVVFIVVALLSVSACKKWEGRYFISNAACEADYFKTADTSKFAVGIEVANEEYVGVGAIFADWDFEIYDADGVLLLKINKANYDTLDFYVTVFAEVPIPDNSYLTYQGLLNVLTGKEKDRWRVPGDIFGGKTPKTLKYTLKILDDNNYTSFFSGELPIQHAAN